MKIKLNLLERFNILQILPKTGNFATLNIINKLQETLAPSEQEINEYEIHQEGQIIGWNENGLEFKEIEISEQAFLLISQELKKLDKNEKLTNQHLSVFGKFVNI